MVTENVFEFNSIRMVAKCFGWGIRGSIIGGEKGALLPGAFMGIMCVWYTGLDLLLENVFLFTAAGAIGFSYGAMEPYAETMGTILHHDSPHYNPRRGYIALVLKGSLFGGIGAGILGLGFSAASGSTYQWYDLVIFCAQIPLAQAIGYRIFNTPYAPEKGIRPKICFSINSREEWGRNVVVVLELIIMMLIRGDTFGLIMWLGGALSGSIGWIIGIFLYDKEMHPLKNGKFLFGKLETHNLIDGWKMMEFTQGAVYGLGISIAFTIAWPLLSDKFVAMEATGLRQILPNTLDQVLSWVVCALIILTLFLFIIPYMKNGKKITTAFGEVDMHVVELLERPFYMVLPLALILLGSMTMARIMCFFVMYYVLAQHDGLERFWDYKHIGLIRIILILVGAAILIGEILGDYTLWQTWLLYGVVYMIFHTIYFARPKKIKENYVKSKNFGQFLTSFRENVTTFPFFVLLLVILLVFGAYYFI